MLQVIADATHPSLKLSRPNLGFYNAAETAADEPDKKDRLNYPLEPNLDWTDHFVKHGFAVLRDQLTAQFMERALHRVRLLAGVDLPYEQWTVNNVRGGSTSFFDPVFGEVFDEHKVRAMIAAMYGTAEIGAPNGWNGARHAPVFLNPFSPGSKQGPPAASHVDFGHEIIPVLGSGFSFHVLLRDSEPFGGNYTIWPGSHKVVQKMVMDQPDLYPPDDFGGVDFGEPFEFYGAAGDMIVIHHLAQHSARPCCGTTRKPRIGLHAQVPRTTWLKSVDPENPNMSPFERSMALNGKVDAGDNEQIIKAYNANKRAIEGVWATEGGNPIFKVFRHPDGATRAKSELPDAMNLRTSKWRFDGRRLRFEQIFTGPPPEGAKGVFGLAGKHPHQGSRYRTELEVAADDANLMTCQVSIEGSSEAVTTTLHRVPK